MTPDQNAYPPWWCNQPDRPQNIPICRKCKNVEIWGTVEYGKLSYHCKAIKYRDHTGTLMASPCINIDMNDCPIHRKTLSDFGGDT